eukprot:g7689.t1
MGGRHTPVNRQYSTNGDRNGNGRSTGKRPGVLEAGGSLFVSPGSPRSGDGRGFLGGGGKKRRGRTGEPGRNAGPAAEPGSSRGPADRASSTTPPARPSNSRKTNGRRGKDVPSTSYDAGGGTRDGYVAGLGGRKQRLRGGSPRGKAIPGDEEHQGAAAPFPVFDELSRWKVTRSSVPKMVRLAGEAQRVALSNLALAEEYRRALASELQKKMSSALPSASTNATNINTASASKAEKTGTPSRPDAAAPLSPPAAAGKRAPFWKRRGRALTARKKRSGAARPAAATSGGGEKEFFCADALSVCIGSIVGS